MAEINPEKTYIYIEDNGDDTCTATMNVPEAGIHATVLAQTSLLDMIGTMSQAVSAEAIENFVMGAVEIPNSPPES